MGLSSAKKKHLYHKGHQTGRKRRSGTGTCVQTACSLGILLNLEGSFSEENYSLFQGKAGYSTELQLTVFWSAGEKVEEDHSFICKIEIWLGLLTVVVENSGSRDEHLHDCEEMSV